MRRKTFDMLVTAVGAMLTLVLLVAGGLAMWGYQFANDNVREQLTAQRIFFPPKGSPALNDPEIKKHVEEYAGQQVVDGRQAYVYGEHYIGAHLKATAGGKTYAEVSTASRANPADQQLQQQVQTLFRGETLRGLLLNAYAFWQVGQIALWVSIGAFIAAAIMLVLTILGMIHMRRVTPEEEILAAR